MTHPNAPHPSQRDLDAEEQAAADALDAEVDRILAHLDLRGCVVTGVSPSQVSVVATPERLARMAASTEGARMASERCGDGWLNVVTVPGRVEVVASATGPDPLAVPEDAWAGDSDEETFGELANRLGRELGIGDAAARGDEREVVFTVLEYELEEVLRHPKARLRSVTFCAGGGGRIEAAATFGRHRVVVETEISMPAMGAHEFLVRR